MTTGLYLFSVQKPVRHAINVITVSVLVTVGAILHVKRVFPARQVTVADYVTELVRAVVMTVKVVTEFVKVA